MRINVARLNKGLENFGAGKRYAEMLHRSCTLAHCTENVMRIQIWKERILVISGLLISKDEFEAILTPFISLHLSI